MSMPSIPEIHERMAQGWTFAEARMGKGWEAKYPNIASWWGGSIMHGSDGVWTISLFSVKAHPGSAYSGFHTTTYTLVEKKVVRASKQDGYQELDDFIQAWNAEHGAAVRQRLQQDSQDEAWAIRYPHVAAWIKQGKRHCIRINLNCVTQKSSARVWLYDKPSDTETIVFAEDMTGLAEGEVLQRLDASIASWLRQHEQS